MLTAALEYAGLGWPVLPIVPRGKVPLTEHGLKDASTDPEVIGEWWSRWPDANIAVRTDELVIVDCDGLRGKRTFGTFIGSIGFESSPYAWTGGGGMHVWYRRDGLPIRNRAGWIDHVDIRSEGGYCIVPPSIHSSGADYYWEHGPDERPVPPLPALLRDALTQPNVTVCAIRPLSTLRVARSIGDKYVAVAFDGELDKVRAAPVGQRNATLVSASFSLGQLVAARKLEPDMVAGALLNAATVAGLPQTEALRTIDSGMRAGIDRPRVR